MNKAYQSAIEKIKIALREGAEHLDLADAELSEIPDEISELKDCIKSLSASRTRIGESGVSKIVRSLPNLEKINLSGVNITQIPDDFEIVADTLKSLNVSQCKISEEALIKVARFLHQLEFLDLSDTAIERMPDIFLTMKIPLKHLVLSRCPINDQEIEKIPKMFPDLETIDIEECYEIGSEGIVCLVDNLDKLSKINLRMIAIKDGVLKRVVSSKNINSVPLAMNPFSRSLRRFIRDYGQGVDKLRQYFNELEEKKFVNSYTNLILVGNSNSGKTTLAKALINGIFDQSITTTHGINHLNWPTFGPNSIEPTYQRPGIWTGREPFINIEAKNPSISVNIIDFGGQAYYHNTHFLFFKDYATFILVWENLDSSVAKSSIEDNSRMVSDRDNFPLIYWLDTIRAYAPFSNIILVQNKTDVNLPIEVDSEIKSYYSIKTGSEFNISLKGALIDKDVLDISKYDLLTKSILYSLQSTAQKDTVKGVWIVIRNEIKTLDKNIVPINEFVNFCLSYDHAVNVEELISYLNHTTGDILFFKDNEVLKGYVFLKPEWLTSNIYKILNQQVVEDFGKFDLTHVEDCLTGSDKEYKNEIVEVMKKFEIIFENPEKENSFIAPHYLPEKYEDQKILKLIGESMSVSFRIQFSKFMPQNVISKFINRYAPLTNNRTWWKSGMYFTLSNFQALIFCVSDKKQIVVKALTGAESSDYKFIVFNSILELCAPFSDQLSVSIGEDDTFVLLKELRSNHRSNLTVRSINGEWVSMQPFFPFLGIQSSFTEITQLIVSDQIESAIEKLKRCTNDSDIITQLLVLLGRYNKLKRGGRLDILTYEEKNVEKNRISEALIEITSQVCQNGES